MSLTRPLGACPEGHWTRLPDALISELTPREHHLVHALLSYRWFSSSPICPFVATLADRIGCSRRTVQRTLRSLERKGYLVTVARYRDDSDHGQTSNVYGPGPLLLPLLPLADDRPGAQPGSDRRPPMTGPTPGNRLRNQTKGTRGQERPDLRDYGSTDHLMTRYGRLAPRR